MKQRISVLASAPSFAAIVISQMLPASAQTFDSYRCVDGTQFILAFYPSDKRAYIQIDGHAVRLKKSLALSGMRYLAAA
jgi:membrane-bound inhibitor of C-type lysozyme